MSEDQAKATLEQRFLSFLNEYEYAENIDLLPNISKQSERADYLLFKRKAVVEVKSLLSDVSEHIDSVLSEHKKRPEYPVFYGSMHIENILRKFPDRAAIRLKIIQRLTRSLEKSISKANRQLRSTKAALNLPDAWGLIIILNESIGVLSPSLIVRTINEMMFKKSGDDTRYQEISWALIVNESHVTTHQSGVMTQPVISLEGPMAVRFPGSSDYMTALTKSWIESTGSLCIEDVQLDLGRSDDIEVLKSFVPLAEEIKQRNPIKQTHEHWRNHYRANRFLQTMTDKEFAGQVALVIRQLENSFVVGRTRPPRAETEDNMKLWTYCLEEASLRGFDMRMVQQLLKRK
ncbi:MAG: hypothetical protein WBP58_05195 [Chitinophagaceae bacterium]